MIKTIGLFLLMLLKFLGVFLLVLFLILMAVLLLAAFVPVRYDVQVQNEKSMNPKDHNPVKNIRVQVKISWLLHLIHISVSYGPEGIANKIKAAGIDIQKVAAWFSHRKETRRRKQQKQNSNAEKTDFSAENQEQILEKPDPSEIKQMQISQEPDTDHIKHGPVTEQSDANHIKSDSDTEQSDSRKKSGSGAGNRKPGKKISAKDSGERKKIHSGRMDKIRKKFQQFYKEYTDETNRHALSRLWKEICFLLRNYKPRKFKADITFSLSDPAITGGVLGVISLMPIVYRYPCSIIPDFASDKLYMEGSFIIQGKVRICIFLLSLLRLIRDKEFRQTARRLMKRG